VEEVFGTTEQVQNEELTEAGKDATEPTASNEGGGKEFSAEASKAEEAGASKTKEGTEVVTGEKREREESIKEPRDFQGGDKEGEKKDEQEDAKKNAGKKAKKRRLSGDEVAEGEGGPSTEKKTKGRQRKTSTKAKAAEPKKRAGRPKKSAAVVQEGAAASAEGEPQEHQQETNVASEDVPAGHTRSRS
jgi:hypothetical protein